MALSYVFVVTVYSATGMHGEKQGKLGTQNSVTHKTITELCPTLILANSQSH